MADDGRAVGRLHPGSGDTAMARRQAALRRNGQPGASPGLLAALRGRCTSAPVLATREARVDAALAPTVRPRMVLAIDATASRERSWETARSVTDSLFSAVPGGLEVALAVHGGHRMSMFTRFHDDPRALRDDVARVTCRAGRTRLLDILAHARGFSGVRVIVYIGDNFEEDPGAGMASAAMLGTRGIGLVILHDLASARPGDADIFAAMATRTGGCVLPFDAGAPARLRDLLESLAAYAVGGREMLRQRIAASPGARLLLEHMSE